MRSCIIPAVICLLLVGLTDSASYAYYKYTTAEGTVSFADSLETVPPRYRNRAVQITYAHERSRKLPEQGGRATPDISPSEGNGVPDDPESTKGGFRWNWGVLILLGVLVSRFAKRIERRGFFGHALRFRCITLVLLIVLACIFNRDMVNSWVKSMGTRVAEIRKTMAEQREKDKKPLKKLSERVDEMINKPAP